MSKVMKTMIIAIVLLLLGGTFALVIILKMQEDNSDANTIDTMIEQSYETEEITTDLEDGSFVRIQFKILTDSKSAQEEISKRDFQLKNLLIKELATMTEEDFKS